MIALLCLTLAASTSQATKSQVREVAFGGEQDPAMLRNVLATEGIVALTGVPGLAQAREDALVASARCILDHTRDAAPVSIELQDGGKRSSWAALSGTPMDATSRCSGLEASMERLREVVNTGAAYFTEHVLDDAVRVAAYDQGLMTKMDGGAYHSFSELLSGGHHLDHFHVCKLLLSVLKAQLTIQKDHKAEHTREASLDLHTDQGLFIALVPSVRVSQEGLVSKKEDSFVVETPDGDVTSVDIPAESLVFMMGDGIHFLKEEAHSPLRAVPHALRLAPSEHSVRAWFGRMFFAPSDALLNESGDTFQSVILQVVDTKEFGSMSCSGHRKDEKAFPNRVFRELADPANTNCSAGTLFCWMACRPTTGLTCNTPICWDRNTNAEWENCPTCHNKNASLICSASIPDASLNALLAAGVAVLLIASLF